MGKFKLVSLIIIVMVLFTSDFVKAEGQIAPELRTRYTTGLKKYQLAQEPWLSEEEVEKRIKPIVRCIEEEPNSPETTGYLFRIEDAFRSEEQRRNKYRKFLLEAIQNLSLNDKLKGRLSDLCKDYDLDVTEKDFQNFLPEQANVNLSEARIQDSFLSALLLRCKSPEDMFGFYNKLPTTFAKDTYYFYHSNVMHVYEKSAEHQQFYLGVLEDLLSRTSDEIGLDSGLLNNFMGVLKDIRAIGGFDSLENSIEKPFNGAKATNKARYAFVVAALQTQRHKVSLNLAKKYYLDYADEIDELSYLTKFFYWYWPREEIGPVVEAKIEKLLKPIQAIQNEIPIDEETL